MSDSDLDHSILSKVEAFLCPDLKLLYKEGSQYHYHVVIDAAINLITKEGYYIEQELVLEKYHEVTISYYGKEVHATDISLLKAKLYALNKLVDNYGEMSKTYSTSDDFDDFQEDAEDWEYGS